LRLEKQNAVASTAMEDSLRRCSSPRKMGTPPKLPVDETGLKRIESACLGATSDFNAWDESDSISKQQH
jgi:hypothetical protein